MGNVWAQDRDDGAEMSDAIDENEVFRLDWQAKFGDGTLLSNLEFYEGHARRQRNDHEPDGEKFVAVKDPVFACLNTPINRGAN